MATEKIQNKNISRLNLQVGQSWVNAKIKDSFINTIFKDIDNGDGIIQDNELVILNDSVEKREKTSPQQAFAKINYADYTKDELIKRYPPTKYNIDERKENNKSIICITDKSTGKDVLEVTTEHGENKNTTILENNSAGEFIMRRCYDQDGKLSCYDDSQNVKHNAIADLLYKDICAKDSFGLPTTNHKIEEHVKLIKPKDVIEVLENYQQRFGESFEKSMNAESWLKKDTKGKEVKNRILKHLTKCLDEAYKYDRNYKNENSVISNEHHKGNVYSIIQNGDEIQITNKTTGNVKKLNLENLTNDLPLMQKVKMKSTLQRLPGEILEDIANERIQGIRTLDLSYTINQNSANKREELRKSEDNYLSKGDNIIFDYSSDFNSLIQKIGLSLNYAGFKYKQNSTIVNNKEFMDAYKKGLEKYMNDGNKHIGAEKLFSECYNYLLTGKSEYKNIIENYFPETLEPSDNHIAKVRSMEPYDRCVLKA